MGLAFCSTGKWPSFSWILISVSFIMVLFLNKSGNFSLTRLFSHWLLSCIRTFPIVNLNFFIQSIPSNGVILFLLVIRICIFCLLFSYSISAGIFPRNFTSFLFTSWYRCFTFCISVRFILFSSTDIIEIGDPVSTKNSFAIPFTFTVVVRCLFLSVILFILSIRCIVAFDSSDSPPITSGSPSVMFRTLRL